jgi:hypothetical protein
MSEFNNIDGVCYAFEGGCGKVVGHGTRLTGNTCRWNNGMGLWSDVDARNNVYDGNRSYGNLGQGLRYEDSHTGLIINNLIGPNSRPDNLQCVAAHVPKLLDGADTCTGFQTGTADDHCDNAEIAIVNSDNTVVGGPHAGNKLITYCGGIVINENAPSTIENDKILNNDIIFHGAGPRSDPLAGTNAGRLVTSRMFATLRPNYFDYNRYLVDNPDEQGWNHWRWLRGSALSRMNWRDWQSMGMDVHGWFGTGSFPSSTENGPQFRNRKKEQQ